MPENNELVLEFWKFASEQVGPISVEKAFERWASTKDIAITDLTATWDNVKASVADIMVKEAGITVTFDTPEDYADVMGKSPMGGATAPKKMIDAPKIENPIGKLPNAPMGPMGGAPKPAMPAPAGQPAMPAPDANAAAPAPATNEPANLLDELEKSE